MKTLNNGLQVEVLKVFRGLSKNFKTKECNSYADLIKVRFANGKIGMVCSTEILC